MTYIRFNKSTNCNDISFDSDSKGFCPILEKILENKSEVKKIIEEGLYVNIEDEKYFHHFLVNETRNNKDARYLCKVFLKGIGNALQIQYKKYDDFQEISNVMLHNTKNIQNQIALKLKQLLDEEELQYEPDKIRFISGKIIDEPISIARGLLSILKDFTQINFEYTAQEYLKPGVTLLKSDYSHHKIHTLFITAYYVFEAELEEKNIKFSMESIHREVYVHYPTIKSAISQIFDNALKYCMPNSDIEITFNESGSTIIADIEMTSILLSEEEQKKIFDKKYRSETAKEITKNGDGLGLYIAKCFFDINNVDIAFHRLPNSRIATSSGIQYTRNMFVIKFHDIISIV